MDCFNVTQEKEIKRKKRKRKTIVREQSCKYPQALSYGEGKQKQNEESLAI